MLNLLRGTGSSLTSYIYENSPAGEGGAPQKAYAAAFVLLIFVLLLNLLVDRIGRAHADSSGLAADRRGRLSFAGNFSQISRKTANLSDLMAKVKSMEIVPDES